MRFCKCVRSAAPVKAERVRRGGDGERSIDAMERDDGGAGRGWERLGRDLCRGILPPGVGENGSSILVEGSKPGVNTQEADRPDSIILRYAMLLYGIIELERSVQSHNGDRFA